MTRTALMMAAITALAMACDDDGDTRGAADTTTGADTVDTPDVHTPGDDAAEDTPPPAPAPPLPEVQGVAAAVDQDARPGVVEVHLVATLKSLKVLDSVIVEMMAYNGQIPGPTIHARVGDELVVHFESQLPEDTTIHWHGVRVPDAMDGTPRVQDPVPPGGTFTYRFVVPEAGTFWYHPHVRANEQVEKGLYGALIVHEAEPPTVDRQRLVMVDDILLFESGMPAFMASHPELMHGRTGNLLFTNGVVADPIQATAVHGQAERWRLVNPSNARTFTVGVEGARWRVVGTDGGLIPAPYAVERLEMAVGQRYDLEVVYDDPQATAARLLTWVLASDGAGGVVERVLPVMEVALEDGDGVVTAPVWPAAPALPQRAPDETVTLEFDAANGAHGLEWRINQRAHWDEPLFTFAEGATVRMVLKNLMGPEHPFHLHGQFFEITKRNGVRVTGEPGLKDTVLVRGMETVEILAYMDNPGRWMAHCHILEHAELGMMAEIVVEGAE